VGYGTVPLWRSERKKKHPPPPPWWWWRRLGGTTVHQTLPLLLTTSDTEHSIVKPLHPHHGGLEGVEEFLVIRILAQERVAHPSWGLKGDILVIKFCIVKPLHPQYGGLRGIRSFW